ncbi:MAG: hypothetical protein HZA11_08855 [Nitrospirae bacterium]|nr:hypothetical protein [Nitrospirota bacterium]
MKTKVLRLAIGVFAPLILIALIYGVVTTVIGGRSQGIAIGVLTLYASAIIAGIQIIAYSLIMEFLVNKKIKNIHTAAILSGLLGFLVVSSAYLLMGGFKAYHFKRDPYTLIIGFFIGVAIGYALKYHYDRNRKGTGYFN